MTNDTLPSPISVALLLILTAATWFGFAPRVVAEPPDDTDNKQALRAFQACVGAWRGVGQPRRGSSRDAWQQEVEWSWQFSPQPALVFRSPQGKYFREGRLTADDPRQPLRLTTVTAGGETVVYRGRHVVSDERPKTSDQPPAEAAQIEPFQGELQFTSDPPPAGTPQRITVRMVAGGKRLVVLYERRDTGERYERLAEVGYTRKGSGFGQGTSYVECVVTGGLGTIPVTHQGKTYYVCCTGCREYFDENPDQVLAEYRERKKSKP